MNSLTRNDAQWLAEYSAEVVDYFRPRFEAHRSVFPAWGQLVSRFTDAVDVVRSKGRGYFRAIDESHNELCVADALLHITEDRIDSLQYEPTLPNTDKTIDFLARFGRLGDFYIDVKTIKPQDRNKWTQFKEQLKKGRFPKNITYLLREEWMGGELWHYAYASRSRILEYTLELEEKIALSGIGADVAQFFLVLCGEGFHWRKDELEDFVHFYRNRTHRADDAFGTMEMHYIQEQSISLSGHISAFSCMGRPQGEVQPKRLVWRVVPPNDEVSHLA